MNSPRLAGPLCAAILLAGCATAPPAILTHPEIPPAFAGPAPTDVATWPSSDWWAGYGDPQLTSLVIQAQAANLDLAGAVARIRQAQAQVAIQRSALFPQLTADAQAQRTGVPNALLGVPGGFNGTATTSRFYGVSLGATYELDVWGQARQNVRAAEFALRSSTYNRQTVALTITANVVNDYLAILALRQRIRIARDNIAAITSILDIIRLKVDTGTTSHLDLAREQAQVEAVEAKLPGLQEQETETRYQLALLLGQLPETLQVKDAELDAIHPPLVAPGLPADLLLRRPDVASAEADLRAAHANLDAARAAFLPHLALSGEAGVASISAQSLFRGANFAWDYGATLLQTIFAGGRLIGQKDLARARQIELIAAYRGAVLNAYADVETALGQVANNTLTQTHLQREVTAAREAFNIAELQYRQGATDLLTVLQAQQTLFAARDDLAQVTLGRAQAVTHLYEALGGGWTVPGAGAGR